VLDVTIWDAAAAATREAGQIDEKKKAPDGMTRKTSAKSCVHAKDAVERLPPEGSNPLGFGLDNYDAFGACGRAGRFDTTRGIAGWREVQRGRRPAAKHVERREASSAKLNRPDAAIRATAANSTF